ncbi:MAG: rhomboid family intramembrane serine protease [Actinobacteria bacterium]|nr:MAG: rhomboid family intramembrane serine protease [Actinomycetota bacterium]
MIPLKDNIPTERFALVTVALILANVVVYLLSIRHGGSLWSGPPNDVTVHYGAIPYEFTHPGRHCGLTAPFAGASQIACEGQAGVAGHPGPQPPFWQTAFTSMFMHGGLLHLAGNMLFLWIFGNNVEDSMGRLRFIAFYLLGGLAALAGQVLIDPGSTVPTVGASGAIAAVLGGYIWLYPRARVLTLIFIIFFVTVIELPALAVLGLWFLEQLAFASAGQVSPAGGGGIAYFAHIGGFLFGLVLIQTFVKRRKTVPPPHPVY